MTSLKRFLCYCFFLRRFSISISTLWPISTWRTYFSKTKRKEHRPFGLSNSKCFCCFFLLRCARASETAAHFGRRAILMDSSERFVSKSVRSVNRHVWKWNEKSKNASQLRHATHRLAIRLLIRQFNGITRQFGLVLWLRAETLVECLRIIKKNPTPAAVAETIK